MPFGVLPPPPPRYYFLIKFTDRKHAKQLGARWDPQRKLWYADSAAEKQALLAAGFKLKK